MAGELALPIQQEFLQHESERAQVPMEDTFMYKAGRMFGRAYERAKHEVTKAYYLYLTPENVAKAQSTAVFALTAITVAGGVAQIAMNDPEVAQFVHNASHNIGNAFHGMTDSIADKLHFNHPAPHGGGGNEHALAMQSQVDPSQNEAWCNAQPNALKLTYGQNTTVPDMIAQRIGPPVTQADIDKFMQINVGPDVNNPINPTVFMQGDTIATHPGGCFLIPTEHVPVVPTPAAPVIEVDPNSTTFVLVELLKELWANNKPAAVGAVIVPTGLAYGLLHYGVIHPFIVKPYRYQVHKGAVSAAVRQVEWYQMQGSVPYDTQQFLNRRVQNFHKMYGQKLLTPERMRQLMPDIFRQQNIPVHRNTGTPIRSSRRSQRGEGIHISRRDQQVYGRQQEQTWIPINRPVEPEPEPEVYYEEPEPQYLESPEGLYQWIEDDRYPDGGYWHLVEEYVQEHDDADEFGLDY
ncbi:hypothetical protein KC909_00780 [Candidatus Dojkabacteria bacterium]|uniref:Uncharacterized protein n=1 Tax=Candidatus Dojkabacteria bacterium TaxID=2099670 RepID=A0A955RIZ7_9BACT|nr:hypothetical protein [Candidatus Dojkabacteria bacterium]